MVPIEMWFLQRCGSYRDVVPIEMCLRIKGSIWLYMVVELRMQYCKEIFTVYNYSERVKLQSLKFSARQACPIGFKLFLKNFLTVLHIQLNYIPCLASRVYNRNSVAHNCAQWLLPLAPFHCAQLR